MLATAQQEHTRAEAAAAEVATQLAQQAERFAESERRRAELHGCLVEMSAGLKAHRAHVSPDHGSSRLRE